MSSFRWMIAAITLCASPAYAAPISPTFDTFGSLPAATFGGTDIPNDAVAISTFTFGSDTITLGLTAHERFANPPVGNDGVGTFQALPGANFGDPTLATMPSTLLGATWNVGFFIEITGGGTFADFNFDLLYDFDPAAGTDEPDHGVLDFDGALLAGTIDPATISLAEGSENLLFGFFADGLLPFITPPTVGSFDPGARGEYSLALVVSDAAGTTELGRTAIHVDVVPEPSSLVLLGFGASGLLVVRRRHRRRARRG